MTAPGPPPRRAGEETDGQSPSTAGQDWGGRGVRRALSLSRPPTHSQALPGAGGTSQRPRSPEDLTGAVLVGSAEGVLFCNRSLENWRP